jgi:hypothetical protein
MASIPESQAVSEANRTIGSIVEKDTVKSLIPEADFKTSSAAKVAILPPVAEEEEVGPEAATNIDLDMPAPSQAPSLRRVTGRGDLRTTSDNITSIINSQHPDINNSSTSAADTIWIPDTPFYSSSIGSAAARLLELSGVPEKPRTELTPTTHLPLAAHSADTHHITVSTQTSCEDACHHTSDHAPTTLTLHQNQEVLALEGQVKNLTFQLDQAVADIYYLDAQLCETKVQLQQATEDNLDQTDVLLRQIGELREASWNLYASKEINIVAGFAKFNP